jgi:hypothetical protein
MVLYEEYINKCQKIESWLQKNTRVHWFTDDAVTEIKNEIMDSKSVTDQQKKIISFFLRECRGINLD